MAIITRSVCKCAVCSHEWIPAKGEPAAVKRCAACKSARWNQGQAQEAPVEVVGRKTVLMIEGVPGAATCRHRILVKDCRLCRVSL